jgi:hypothetical protein
VLEGINLREPLPQQCPRINCTDIQATIALRLRSTWDCITSNNRRARTAMNIAHTNHPRSISRLHDDELVCVLPFLLLRDAARLVRCSRRFNAVARKERSRGLHVGGNVTVTPLASSSLSHHVTSLHLQRSADAHPPVRRATLGQLRLLPQLTALKLVLYHSGDAAALLRRIGPFTPANAVAALQDVLPTQLRSFSFVIRSVLFESSAKAQLLFSSIVASLPVMNQLHELHLQFDVSLPEMRLDVLVQLPRLRKLSIYGIAWTDERLAELKQFSQLRELHTGMSGDERIQLCQPPHLLQLEHAPVSGGQVDERMMRALLHLPTLTELEPQLLLPSAWPLLPGLSLLRRLAVPLDAPLSAALTTLLSAALSNCRALTDLSLPGSLTHLSLPGVSFKEDRGKASDAQQQAQWTELLGSVPQLLRFKAHTRYNPPLYAVLPTHLPQLTSLSLLSSREVIGSLAHPTVQELELTIIGQSLTAVQMQKLNSRLPSLRRCECL